MMEKSKKLLITLASLFVFTLPVVVHAANNILVPCGTDQNPCTFLSLLDLANNVIMFLITWVALPLFICMYTYAGFLLMTSGDNAGNRTKAKHIFLNTMIGFIVALAAFIIIRTILTSLGYHDTGGPVI